MIRLFAALAVPEEIAQALNGRQQGLSGARWRPAESLHVTLRFFGDVQERIAEDLDAALTALATEDFEVSLRGAGAFGDRERMRAVWAGVNDTAPLRSLAAKCETAARRCGLAAEGRAFRPHVTLAYLKAAPQAQAAAWVQAHNLLQSPPWRAGTFHLYSSWLGQTGSRYELERSYPLVGATSISASAAERSA